MKSLLSKTHFFILFFLLLWVNAGRGQIISQYVETNSGTEPKGIEIYNNTGETLDFSTNNLVVQQGTNGGSLSTKVTVSSGTLAHGEVMVIGTSDIGTYLTNQGLSTVTFVQESFQFNGDDALAIKYGSSTTDVFGNPGSDPGSAWSGNGVSTKDQNIQLLSGITTGDTDGWTDPSARFETTSSDPVGSGGLTGFGISPSGGSSNDTDTEVYDTGSQPASSSIASTETGFTNIFSIEIEDMASGDGLPTKVTNIRLKPHSTNTADWTDHISAIKLNNGSDITLGTVDITDNYIDIAIPAGNLQIADGGSDIVTVQLQINNTGITDGAVLSFMVDADDHGFTADASGSGFASSFMLGDFNSNDFTIDVTFDELRFMQQPSNTNVSVPMNPAVTVAATDANGNVDKDFNGEGYVIGLTTTGSFDASSTTSVDAVNGVATFNNLVFDESAISINLSTTDPDGWGWSNITSNSFDVLNVIYIQDFDGRSPEWTYSNDVSFFDNGWGADGYYGIIAASSASPLSHSNFSGNILGENDLDDEGDNGTSGFTTIDFTDLDISGYTDVVLSFDWQIDGYNANDDDAKYEIFYDGSGQGEIYLVDGGTDPEDGQGTVTINVPDDVNTLDLNIMIRNNGSNGYSGFDNFRITASSTTCTHSISSFAPESGPVGTEVKITGSGFAESSTVSFNGTQATTVRFVNENTLIAEMPTGASTGKINVTESSCTTQSSADFSLIEENGSCGGGSGSYSDVFISEIYDAQSGSLGYIELYNGKGAAIDLSSYSIKRFNNDAGSSTHTYTFPSGTTINNGETLLGKVSTDGNVSGVSPDFTFTGSTSGFNDKDRLELWDASSQIDEVIAQAVSTAGYSYWRKTDATAPSTTFNSDDWTYSTTEETTDIGNFATTPAPSLTSQPADANSCSVSMSISATGTSLTYQWKYNDGSASGWSDVSPGDFSPATVSGQTSDALSISGTDIATFDGYQFYCQVTEDGSCSSASHAAQFVITPERYFRSKQSGNWNDAANWEMSADGSSGWTDACTYPTNSNTDEIIVLNGHTLSIIDDAGTNPDLLVDQLTISESGKLTIPATAEMHINNENAGADFIVNGTLQDNSSSGAGNGISFISGATWQLGANGTIIKTRNSSVSNYRDNYESGISSIPTTANWYFRYEGNLLSIITIGMYYPNLYFESNSGDYIFNNSTEVFSGSSDIATVKGNLDIGGSGSGTVSIYNENTNTAPILIQGDLIVRNGSTLSNSRGSIAGTGFEVQGDLIVNGTLDLNSASTGLLKFSGTNEQTFSGNGTFDLYDVEVNKPAKKIIFSTAHTDIENDLSISGGTLQLAEGKWLTVGNTLTNSVGASGLLLKSNGTSTASVIHSTPNITATVERALLGQTWQYIFAPLSQIEQSYFTTTNYGEDNPNFYFYDETKPDYWNSSAIYGTTGWTKPSDQYLQTDNGYLLWERHARHFVQTGGRLLAADKNFDLNYTQSGTGNAPAPVSSPWANFDGWNLIGNPYTAAIDWDNPAIDKTDVNNMVYLYDGSSKNYKYYGDGGASVNGATRYIPAGQAFFIKATANTTLTIPASARTHNTQAFYKSAPENQVLRLQVKKGSFCDETLIRILTDATVDFDQNKDAYKMFSLEDTVPQIYSCSGTKKVNFAINTLPEITEQTIIPLGLDAGNNQNVEIELTKNNINLTVILEDEQTGTWTTLKKGESYQFTSKGKDKNRFFLHFSTPNCSSTNSTRIENQIHIYPNPAKEKTFIVFEYLPNSNIEAGLYNLNGMLVKNYQFTKIKNKLETHSLPQGCYFLKIKYNDSFINKKITILK